MIRMIRIMDEKTKIVDLPETPTLFPKQSIIRSSYTTEDIIGNKCAINQATLDSITGKLDATTNAGILFGIDLQFSNTYFYCPIEHQANDTRLV